MSKKQFFKIIFFFITSFYLVDISLSYFLENGLKKYYGIDNNNEMALIGHSHLMLGIDKNKLEKELKVGVSKYTREGVNVADRLVMIKQLLKNNENLKTVIYGVDAWTFTGEGLSENSHKLFYPFMDDGDINQYIKSIDKPVDYWLKKIVKTSRFNELLVAGAIRGYLSKWDNYKYGTLDTLKLVNELKMGVFRKIENKVENINTFKKTLYLLKKKNIRVILLNIPSIDYLQNVQKAKFNETMSIFKSQESKNVLFINLQDPWSHKHELFYDPIHLNPKGQAEITVELIKILHKLK